MLPEISVPRIGTPGERHRDRQLAKQLPKQDLARAYCRHLDMQHSASADDFMAARNEIALDIGSVKEILGRGHVSLLSILFFYSLSSNHLISSFYRCNFFVF